MIYTEGLSTMNRKAFTLIELLVVIAIIAILAAILFPVFAQAREKARAISCLSNQKQIAMGITMYVQDYDETFPEMPYDALNTPPTSVLTFWTDQIQPYIKNKNIFNCPDSGANEDSYASGKYPAPDYHVSYAVSEYVFNQDHSHSGPETLAAMGAPAEMGLTGDGRWAYTYHNCIADANGLFTGYWLESDPLTQAWGYGDFKGNLNSPSRDLHHSNGANFSFVDGHAKWDKLSLIAPADDGPDGLYYGYFKGVKMTEKTFSTFNACDAGNQ